MCDCIEMQLIFVYWFCIPQLYWIHLLVLIFLIEVSEFSANRDNFTSAFLIWIPFISFSWLVTLVKTSCTKLSKSGESGHLCVVSGLKGKAFIFLLLSLMLAVGLSYMTFYYHEVYWCFYLERVLNFVKCFISIYSDDHDFYPSFGNVLYHLCFFKNKFVYLFIFIFGCVGSLLLLMGYL